MPKTQQNSVTRISYSNFKLETKWNSKEISILIQNHIYPHLRGKQNTNKHTLSRHAEIHWPQEIIGINYRNLSTPSLAMLDYATTPSHATIDAIYTKQNDNRTILTLIQTEMVPRGANNRSNTAFSTRTLDTQTGASAQVIPTHLLILNNI